MKMYELDKMYENYNSVVEKTNADHMIVLSLKILQTMVCNSSNIKSKAIKCIELELEEYLSFLKQVLVQIQSASTGSKCERREIASRICRDNEKDIHEMVDMHYMCIEFFNKITLNHD